MKFKLHYAWWAHIPAALLASFSFIGFPFFMGATPYAAHVIFLGALSWLLLGVSVALDEGYARREAHKTFNWLSLLDELIIGGIVALQTGFVVASHGASSDFLFSPIYLLPGILGIALAVGLEARRPFRAYQSPLTLEDVSAFKGELAEHWQSGQTAVCWETYTPPIWLHLFWLAQVALLLPFIRFFDIWFQIFLAVFLVGEILDFQRDRIKVAVTQKEIRVRKGVFSFRPLILNPTQVNEVDVYLVSEAEDFRGYKSYGAEFHRRYIFFSRRGNRYVRIIGKEGKKYLIAADHPDRLAAAIRAAKQAAA
jgi:hypothetical protein